jgi:ribosomal protein S8
MKPASKIELLNRVNNKLSKLGSSGSFSVIYSKDALNYLEILYKEGRVASYKKIGNKLIITIDAFINSSEDKVHFENNRYRDGLKYEDIIKLNVNLKTMYFHTNKGQKTLEDVKKYHLGGFSE